MLKVIMTKGLPASGKTTFAKTLVDKNPNTYKRINKDDLRAMLDNNKHSKDAEKFILNVRDQLILLALENHKHVIVDDTNLAPKHEERIRLLVKGKAEFKIKDFTNISLEECLFRDSKRPNPVGKDVILKMYNQFLKPPQQVYEHKEGLQHIVICDLDGTLSLLNGRDPYDASTCDKDLLSPVIDSIIRSRDAVLVSGRSDKYKPQTLAFLEKHDIKYIKLLMRKEGDFRKDYLVKQEIFETEIRDRYNVDFCLDDRNQVVDLWRSLGLTCLQVADGNF